MPDLEKVLTWLEICGKNRDCSGNCPYSGALCGEDDASRCREDLMADALALLKEQDTCENCAIAIEDRQPVVRCKDCKYWRQLYGDKSSIGCCDCYDMWRSLDGETTEVNDIKTDSDFYCGYAVRRWSGMPDREKVLT